MPAQTLRDPGTIAFGAGGSPDGPGWLPGTSQALTVYAPRAHSARSSRSSAAGQEPHAGREARREQVFGEGARASVRRARLFCPERASRLRSPRCARRWELGAVGSAPRCALGSGPLHSLPPPAQSSFKSAPALAESELINMQKHSVTH